LNLPSKPGKKRLIPSSLIFPHFLKNGGRGKKFRKDFPKKKETFLFISLI